MAKDRPDFVNVRLTEFGAKLAGEGKLLFIEGGRKFEFEPGVAVEVTKAFDWKEVLAKHFIDGEAVFELAETVPTSGDEGQGA